MAEIEEHIKDAELGSVRFNAFADHVDYLEAELLPGEDPKIPSLLQRSAIEAHLIKETIRQRKNEVKGYKREFDQATKLADGLYNSIYRNSDGTLNDTALDGDEKRRNWGQNPKQIDILIKIKNQAIDQKSQKP